MRRLKLVVSDFHLFTGRRLSDGSINRMEDMADDERFIEFIEYHSTGSFTSAEVELIINGDFFNLLQVPIDGVVPTEITENIAIKQMEKILNGHPRLFDALETFANTNAKQLTFTVGNHDQGLLWPQVKRQLKRRLGERIAIHNRAYVFDGVHIEHGDKYEPVHEVNAKLPFLSKGLGEPILNIPFGSYFFINFVRKLKHQRSYIDKVKPFRNYLTWSAIWDFRFFALTITRLLLFVLGTMIGGRVGSKRFGFKLFFTLLRQNKPGTEAQAAKRMLADRANIHTIIFGHTHNPVSHRWEGGEYFNTGCWNAITSLDISGLGYQQRYTYAYLEWEDNRWLTGLRLWKGAVRPFEEYLG